MTKPTFFETAADFRRWLETHHATARELWVGFRKKGTGLPGITPSEAIDEALCFGWIDGVRRSIDDESYAIRVTPRKPHSTWSTVNTRRARELIQLGWMEPPGIAAFENRDPERTAQYSFERERAALTPAYLKQFRAREGAWDWFRAQPPSYRKTMAWWVMSAKREETRLRRLESLIDDCAAGRRIPSMRPRSEPRGRA